VIDPLVRAVDPADPIDLAQVRLLEVDARAALVGQRGGDRWLVEHPQVGDRWAERLAEPGLDVVVACIDDIIVGYLVAVLGSDHIVRVDQVWVDPEARECGFGDELLATAIARAQANGAVAVEGESLPGDRHTKNLYERAGIVARLITTYKTLTGRS
jgi:ribosomal protein S18 acetylase RimI-like enzyme